MAAYVCAILCVAWNMKERAVPKLVGLPDELSRREAFGYAAGAGAVAATTIYGLRLPERVGEYVGQSPNIRLIFGNHELPEGYGGNINRDVYQPYLNNGDLTISAWPQKPLSIIDAGMRRAKRAGIDSYIISVDGASVLLPPPGTADVKWPWIPHPDLMNQTAYPQHIYLINTEPPTEDFLGSQPLVMNPNDLQAQREKKALIKEIRDAYSMYTPDKTMQQFKGEAEEGALLDGELAVTGIVTHAVNKGALSRRGLLTGLLGSAAVVQMAKAATRVGMMAPIIGDSGNYGAQKVMTEVESATGQKDYGNYLDTWIKARTALAVQKVIDVRESIATIDLSGKVKPDTIPADILYGSAHTFDAPEITTDVSYRKQLIQAAAREFLGRIDTLIQTKYHALARGKNHYFGSYRDQILLGAMQNYISYSYSPLLYPWGIQSPIDPSSIPNFEASLLQGQTQTATPGLDSWGAEVLKEFRVTAH